MVLALQSHSPRQTNTALRLEVVSALTDLNRCDNCHPLTITAIHYPRAEVVHTSPAPKLMPFTPTVQDAVNAELRELGQRVVSISTPHAADYTRAASYFMATYQQTHTDQLPGTVVNAQHMLRDLRSLVVLFEHQAAHEQWTTAAEIYDQSQTNLSLIVPVQAGGKWIADIHTAPVLVVRPVQDVIRLSEQYRAGTDPALLVAQRRGPPTLPVYDSHNDERLQVVAVQSLSFSYPMTIPGLIGELCALALRA